MLQWIAYKMHCYNILGEQFNKMLKYFKFNFKFFCIAIIIFVTEIIIALFINDNFIRPYFGDFLVVILIYCFIKSFFNFPKLPLAIATLLFSYLIETLQYFNFVKLIGLQKSKFANIVFGNSFAWSDIVAYTLGIVVVVVMEKCTKK